MEYVRVRDAEVPAIGLGTWQLTGEQCYETVSTALELGYRHVDTAQLYGNEREVGSAIADADVDREDVFLTTKVTPGNARYDDVIESTRASLDRLDTDYVDLLLLHWPAPLVSFRETARAMAELRDEGLVRHAGVSNFRRWRLKRAREKSPIPLVADQVRLHPHYTHRSLREYCADVDAMVTAYSPLAHGGLVDDDLLARIGERYGKTPAQVALRWVTQLANVAAIPKSTNREHLAGNLAALDFELTDAEMERIDRPSLVRSAGLFLRNEMGL
ncbi:aldo/keto reductase [Halomicrobium salinisoli]|uniref:aldo/keto reductase n=1 Tax=Halomicrobium salinisoli TaxID=2878391 RepID=UPI001CF052CF|nr:aldo/keto reductase [Halomicrobium salinisoli]